MSFDYLESYQTEEIRAGGPLSLLGCDFQTFNKILFLCRSGELAQAELSRVKLSFYVANVFMIDFYDVR